MSKITGYAALTGPAPDDVLITVDVSDTSMAGTGTDKKLKLSQLVPGYRPWQFHVAAYGARGDGVVLGDAAMTSGSAVLTSASAAFTAADVGKAIMVNGAGAGGAGNPSVALFTTIAAYTSATQVTLTAANAHGSSITAQAAVYGTDDTTAIQAAMAALTASPAMAGAPYYAELLFDPAIYIMAGPTVKGGATLGNALIPLPVPDTTDLSPKRTVVIRGVRDGATLDFWIQATPNLTGTCIVAMGDVTTYDATWLAPSVIGGPTVNTSLPASGAYDNILAVIDGINVVSPHNPGWIAYDFYFLCHYAIHNSSAQIFWAPNGLGHTPALTNQKGLGLRTLRFGTNNRCDIDSLAVEGYYTGMTFDQHISAPRVAIIYSHIGIFMNMPGGSNLSHGCWFGYLSIEVCQGDAIQTTGSAGSALFGLSIGMLDTENITGNDISDTANALTGRVMLLHNGSATIQTPVVTGAANLEIISVASATSGLTVRGTVTAPSVPATTVPLMNPYWRHATVYITSGGAAVTVITVDGTATGLTLGTTGTVMVRVPSGKAITLTYAAAAPTWTWVTD